MLSNVPKFAYPSTFAHINCNSQNLKSKLHQIHDRNKSHPGKFIYVNVCVRKLCRGRGYRVKKWTYIQKHGICLFLEAILCLKNSLKRILEKKVIFGGLPALFVYDLCIRFCENFIFPYIKEISKI